VIIGEVVDAEPLITPNNGNDAVVANDADIALPTKKLAVAA
jgi:hypothetical protein